MKCCKCNDEAAFDAPEFFCETHWIEWWMEGYKSLNLSDQEQEELRKEVIVNMEIKKRFQ